MTKSPSPFTPPNWTPAAEPGKRLLIVGASGGPGHAARRHAPQGL